MVVFYARAIFNIPDVARKFSTLYQFYGSTISLLTDWQHVFFLKKEKFTPRTGDLTRNLTLALTLSYVVTPSAGGWIAFCELAGFYVAQLRGFGICRELCGTYLCWNGILAFARDAFVRERDLQFSVAREQNIRICTGRVCAGTGYITFITVPRDNPESHPNPPAGKISTNVL